MTIICAQCSTRNPSDATHCRRCRAPLANAQVSTVTRRGSPTASVLGERWVVDGPLFGAKDKSLFLGHDIDTQQPVVIKRLSEQLARDRSMRSQFFHEARVLSQLNHTNLARVIDVIESQSEPAMILEYFEGETLQSLLNRHGRLPVGVALEFAGQILDGLQDLHAQGIIHRQLTPSAIQVRIRDNMASPILVLSDFGIAQFLPSVDTSGTLIGMRAGDVLSAAEPTIYSAPEMLTLDAQMSSDLYALGVIFFQMLTGTSPLPESHDRDELVHDINETPAIALRKQLPGASAILDRLIASLLQKDPNARPRDASTFMELLLSVPEHHTETMLYIPGGEFLQGSAADEEGARKEEMPMRRVDLSPFYIDKTPVTASQFVTFLRATNHDMPREWWTFNDPEDHPTLPVVFVNWFDAKAYAQWAGKRLLTEAEWEKAARGTEGFIYPWGNEPPAEDLAWYGDKTKPHIVAGFPRGASIYNVLDMSGNVFEWVQDWYDKYYYRNASTIDPAGPSQGKKKVLKGGSFVHPSFALRCAVRGRYVPLERRANHSFRCAWSMD